MPHDKVVVAVKPEFGKDVITGCTVGRYRELGLYAHGQDHSEVLEHLKVMFRKFIRFYRDQGRLEEVLDSSGIDWWTIEDAERAGVPYEDVAQSNSPNVPESRAWVRQLRKRAQGTSQRSNPTVHWGELAQAA